MVGMLILACDGVVNVAIAAILEFARVLACDDDDGVAVLILLALFLLLILAVAESVLAMLVVVMAAVVGCATSLGLCRYLPDMMGVAASRETSSSSSSLSLLVFKF